MGIFNSIKKNGERASKYKKEQFATLNVSESNKSFGSNLATLYRDNDGYFYFNKKDDELFSFINIKWNGAEHTTVSRTSGSSTSQGKNKRTGRVLGAVVGTVIAPGVGTVIGAAHGSGNQKTSQFTNSSSITTNEDRERPTTAYLTIKYKSTNEEETFSIKCLSMYINKLISCVTAIERENKDGTADNYITKLDAFEQVKKFKELLDIGAISQDEYNLKKKEILDL